MSGHVPLQESARQIGYWTQHTGHTGHTSGGWQATCETCGWRGTKTSGRASESGWQQTAAELNAHRDASREWVPVERIEEPDVVYVSEDQSYDFEGLRDVYASLYTALADNPHPWREEPTGAGRWVREDGDAIEQTAMSITRVAVRRREK